MNKTPKSKADDLRWTDTGHESPAYQWVKRLATDSEIKAHIRMFKWELGERQRQRASKKYLESHPDAKVA